MSITTLPDESRYATSAVKGFEGGRVDRDAGIIYGAKAMQFGNLNAGDVRNHFVDHTTLEQFRDGINNRKQGSKSRLSHPNMSVDGMGRHAGRARDARIENEGTEDAFVAVDLHLSEASRRAPNLGNIREYLLDFAEESPEDFGLSADVLLDVRAMEAEEQDGMQPIRLHSVKAVDVVDDPAATRGGLFSLDSDSLADLPHQATWLLDTYFSGASSEVVRARVDNFLNTYLGEQKPMSTETQNDDRLDKIEESIAQLTEQFDKLSEPLEGEFVEVEETDEQTAAKAELNRLNEITALCQLAGVKDDQRDLMLRAGFSREDAQDWLKTNGQLSAINPPVGELDDITPQPETDEDKFGKEWDQNEAVYSRAGVSRDEYIFSRKVDEGLATL